MVKLSTTSSTIGNRCGHKPNKPKLFKIPKSHTKRPDIICIACENVKKFYYEPHSWLQSLLLVRDSGRQNRSESRERDCTVLQVLLYYLELGSMRVGIPYPEDNTFRNINMSFIAKEVGYRKASEHSNKGVMRVCRSLNNLKRVGYLEINKKFTKCADDKGLISYRGLTAIKSLTPKLFIELGIPLQRLELRRREARKQLYKRIVHEKRKRERTNSLINVLKGVNHVE